MSVFRIMGILGLIAASTYAQTDRPGVDRPIRVGSFMGTGSGRYWHTNIQTAQTALGNALANPSSANLGANLVVPTKGFSFTKFGVTCENCSPTAAQTTAFINALDTLDVAYIGCFVDLGNVISNAQQRDKLRAFMGTKAFVSVHATNDSYGTWPALDSVNATRFQNHPSSDRNGTIRRDSVAETHNDWKYLNQGLFQNGLDTTFLEEWFSYTTNGNVIRAGNAAGSMMVTTKMDENSYQGGMGGARQMGDHPMSWARRMSGGGRVFYTGVGHRVQNYQGGNNPRFLRRQIYNAILWTAKYDSMGVTAVNPDRKAAGKGSDYSRVAAFPSALKVTLLTGGQHKMDLVGIDGRAVQQRSGQGAIGTEYRFDNLRPGVYTLNISTQQGRSSRLVTIP